jgi:hypothetical protein
MKLKWLGWAVINVAILAIFAFGLIAPASSLPSESLKRAWLPGKTTHGHYQIELNCNACHDPSRNSGEPSASDVMQNACISCHGEQLKLANDTHPAKKFRDPVHADLLNIINAQDCLTCHREHVPDQTLSMGLTVPADYCWHCHQDIDESRPSHVGMSHDTCATAGCHNYHDNRALYEKFLADHHGVSDHIEGGRVAIRQTRKTLSRSDWEMAALTINQSDAPEQVETTPELLQDWQETAHAAAGVNCTMCHGGSGSTTASTKAWSDHVAIKTCQHCHAGQFDTFVSGKHGMRLRAGMSPMSTAMARLPMHSHPDGQDDVHGGAAHAELTCNACHAGHRFDTKYAAAEACLRCHADDHSLAYADTAHAALWAAELDGSGDVNSGVSCATCHLPRLDTGVGVFVNHDQNASLRPNETMARDVCLNCHSLEYSLSVLADPQAKIECYRNPPRQRTQSVDMAHEWFEQQDAKRRARKNRSP